MAGLANDSIQRLRLLRTVIDVAHDANDLEGLEPDDVQDLVLAWVSGEPELTLMDRPGIRWNQVTRILENTLPGISSGVVEILGLITHSDRSRIDEAHRDLAYTSPLRSSRSRSLPPHASGRDTRLRPSALLGLPADSQRRGRAGSVPHPIILDVHAAVRLPGLPPSNADSSVSPLPTTLRISEGSPAETNLIGRDPRGSPPSGFTKCRSSGRTHGCASPGWGVLRSLGRQRIHVATLGLEQRLEPSHQFLDGGEFRRHRVVLDELRFHVLVDVRLSVRRGWLAIHES